VSRLCDRVTRRASPGLDSDLTGLGLSFIHPGNVRFSCNTLPISSILAFSTRQIHLSSVTGSARNPLGSGKPFGVRQTTPPAAVIWPRRCARSGDFGIADVWQFLQFASNTSRRPPVSITKCPLRGFGRARSRGCLCALRGIRGPEAGRKQTFPGLRLPPVIAEELPRTEYFRRPQTRPCQAL
jgi:hypothetical protein